MNGKTPFVEAPPGPAEDLLVKVRAHVAADQLEDGEALVDRLLASWPDHGELVHLKGSLAWRRNDQDEAARLMERSLTLEPVLPHYFSNLCEVYRKLGRFDEALALGRKAADLHPDNIDFQINLSVLHYSRREPAQAIVHAERALALDPSRPDGHFGLAEPYLLLGDMERGWEEYQWRFGLDHPAALAMPKLDIPFWDGRPLPGGRLLVVADQGFGDVLQFCRYIPWAASQVGEVMVACGPELQSLVGQLPGAGRLFTSWEDAPPAQAYCALSGLPRLHGGGLDAIPSVTPYLRADPARVEVWAELLGALVPSGHRRVGLVWAGRPEHNNDRQRSATLKRLAPLTAVGGVTFVSLQMGPAMAQIGDYFGAAPLINLGAQLNDFDDTAAIIENLDLVVTVDTSVAHLTGALGKPVWIMLAYAPDWRWLLDRIDSPWYPTARLFRQPDHHAWDEIAHAVADALGGKPP